LPILATAVPSGCSRSICLRRAVSDETMSGDWVGRRMSVNEHKRALEFLKSLQVRL